MKLLHTTDLHFNKNWFDFIAKQQNDFDIFCISGDLLESSKEQTIQEQIKWLTSWIKEFKKPLFICSRNHDIEDFNNNDWLKKISSSNYYSDTSKRTINNTTIACCEYLDPSYLDFYDCDILVTHLPPSNTKTSISKKIDEDWGDKELTRMIKNNLISPKIILCGHMHYPIDNIDIFKNTKIYNPGVDKNSDIPNCSIIEI
jgi:Icc-related predicted phosphoesterase